MQIIDQKLKILDEAIRHQFDEKTLKSGINTALALLEILGCKLEKSSEDIELTKIQLPNSERYDHWFKAHPFFKSDRSCFEIIDSNEIPLQAKFYWLQKKSKISISGGVHFTPNWEDSEFTRTEGYKVGIDFFLSPDCESLLVVLSDRGNLRIVELNQWLRSTQIEIFKLWMDFSNIKSPEILHSSMWKSFQLQAVNEKFFIGIVNSFTELVQHLQTKVKKIDEVDARQFVNRLIGRLLFCWFLKKKNVLNKNSGYFDIGELNSIDYYRAKLEPLFFLTLNTPIKDRVKVMEKFIEKNKETRIKFKNNLFKTDLTTPYLNGGLFEAHINDYFAENLLSFPDGYFVRLFEHFDSYNFTTDESSPEYEQVAIDPEMLGKVFESLLASFIDETGSAERNKRGTFYTPREIVSQMCRETIRDSLKSHFTEEKKIHESIDALIDTSLSEWAIGGTNSKRDSVKANGQKILEVLISMTSIDPACGSGAFPIGMLNELIRIHQRLKPSDSQYELKIKYLRDSIYGIDIEPMAIEICRLRAWLSILVDSPTDFEVLPLPNLDFKFIAADSLTKLPEGDKHTLFGDNDLEETLTEIRKLYFDAKDAKVKLDLRNKYLKKIASTKENYSINSREQLIRTFNPFESNSYARFFDPLVFFGVENFDIVIGNPPYVDSHTMTEKYPEFRDYLKLEYESCKGTWDLFVPFIERGLQLTKSNGSLSFIVKNNLYGARYAETIRTLMMQYEIKEIQEFNSVKVFEDASVIPAVFRIKKAKKQAQVKIKIMETLNKSKSEYFIEPKKFYTSSNWIPFLSNEIIRDILEKMNSSKKLRDFAFNIGASATVSEAYELKSHFEEFKKNSKKFKKLINTGTLDRYESYWNQKPTKYLKNIFDAPIIKDNALKEVAFSRYLQSNSPKIIVSGIRSLEAYLDEKGEYIAGIPTSIIYFPEKNDINILKLATLFINSRVIQFWFFKTYSAGGMDGGGVTISPKDLAMIPLPSLTNKIIDDLVTLYDLYLKSKSITDYEKIEIKISKLYGLTDEEIAYIKNT